MTWTLLVSKSPIPGVVGPLLKWPNSMAKKNGGDPNYLLPSLKLTVCT